MRPKKIPEKYVTSERVERAEVAGPATKRSEADMKDRCPSITGAIFISAVFCRLTYTVIRGNICR